MGSQTARTLKSPAQPDSLDAPWLDRDGQPISKSRLKLISRSWDAQTWEDYLESTEKGLYESLVSWSAYIRCTDKRTESIFANAQGTCDVNLQGTVQRALSDLTERQRSVLTMIFWKNMSERDVATELGLSRSTVKVLKKRALTRLKRIGSQF